MKNSSAQWVPRVMGPHIRAPAAWSVLGFARHMSALQPGTMTLCGRSFEDDFRWLTEKHGRKRVQPC